MILDRYQDDGRHERVVRVLEKSTAALVSDALDRLGRREQAMRHDVLPLAPGMRVVARALPILVRATAEIPEDPYAAQRTAVESLRAGEIPVFSVPDGVTAAIWGELFSSAARNRGAVGAVVDGYVRDVRQMVAMPFAVFCRGRSPLDTLGRADVVSYGEPTSCGGVVVSRGDYVVGDDDGVVVVPDELADDVAEIVARKASDEHGALNDLLSGRSIEDVWNTWHVL